MGEYAQFGGQQVKIGTCENMYYLRADQAYMVKPLPGNVDPKRDRNEIRFRFPFPDEDHVEPGRFDPFDRGVPIHGVKVPEGVEHYNVQFSSNSGYLTSLPCPESPEGKALPFKIHKNGWRGDVLLKQQRYWEGRLVMVCACGGCGALYRLPTLEDAEPYIVALRSEGDRQAKERGGNGEFWQTIADRALAGYQVRA